jgi:hypothetical protein
MTDMITWLREQAEADLARANQEAETMRLLLNIHEPDPADHDYLLAISNMRMYRRVKDEGAKAKMILAILSLHHLEVTDYRDGDGTERSSSDCYGCEGNGYPCHTLCLLVSAYRFRDGYDQAWGIDE